MTSLVREALPILALLGLLVVAYRAPRAGVEAAAAISASALALASGLLPLGDLGRTLADLAPVVAFLATVLVVADVCGRAGLFVAAGRLLRPRGDRAGGGVRLFTVAFVLAAAVTAVLSLDATVVLLTPVVVAAAASQRLTARPGAYACLRMANSASLLLPVSNLTNLLALPALGLTFAGFATAMAAPMVAVLVVEYVGLRLLFRRDLATPPATAAAPSTPITVPGADSLAVPVVSPVVPAVVVVAMLLGFVVTSPLGIEPYAVSAAAALVLLVWGRHRRLVRVRDAVAALHLPFALFVFALAVVVAAIGAGFAGDLVSRLVPNGPHADGFVGLLAVAVLATVLANLVTNLSATLLLVPLVAPLGPVPVLAALVGLNVGSGLTLSGSLANLLWRRGLAAGGVRPALSDFHRVSLTITPISVLAAVAALTAVH